MRADSKVSIVSCLIHVLILSALEMQLRVHDDRSTMPPADPQFKLSPSSRLVILLPFVLGSLSAPPFPSPVCLAAMFPEPFGELTL